MWGQASGDYTHTSFSTDVHLKARGGGVRLSVGYHGNQISIPSSHTLEVSERPWNGLYSFHFAVYMCVFLCVSSCVSGLKEGRI